MAAPKNMAITFHGAEQLAYEEIPMPRLEAPSDAVVRDHNVEHMSRLATPAWEDLDASEVVVLRGRDQHNELVHTWCVRLAFAVDGEVILNRSSVAGAPAPRPLLWDEPWYLILNSALGGPWPGEPTEKTQLPTYHRIDYVRASRQAE